MATIHPISSTVDAWVNQPLLLFHGTSLTDAESIMSAVDLTRSRGIGDFGKGFYATTDRRQAQEFAEIVTERRRLASPTVVSIKVDRNQLSNLRALAFVRGSQEASDFWGFVNCCRGKGFHIPLGNRYYDVVYGPVAKNWVKRLAHDGYDQVSFHTKEAQDLLNASPRGML